MSDHYGRKDRDYFPYVPKDQGEFVYSRDRWWQQERNMSDEPIDDIHKSKAYRDSMADVLKKEVDDVLTRFNVHRIDEADQRTLFWMANMRGNYAGLAVEIVKAIPPGRERSVALTKLEEAMFWTSAAAARNNGVPDGFGEPKAKGEG